MEKKDRIEILFEKIRGDVKLILEGHSVLNNKIDRLTERVDQLTERIDLLTGRVDDLDKRLNRVEFEIKTLNTSLTLLNNELKDLIVRFDEHVRLPAHVG